MKLLLLAFVFTIAYGFDYDLTLPSAVLFNQYIVRENVQFKTQKEGQERFQVFDNNVALIKDLNAKQSNAKFGLNKYALYSQEEFAEKMLTLKVTRMIRENDPFGMFPEYPQNVINALPDSWDWRTKGAVTGVKDQGQCGSCWTFSTTGNIEGQWFLTKKVLISLSEQNIVDCDHLCANGSCDSGCNGGLMGTAFDYVIQNGGIDTEASYPYTAVDGTCHYNAANKGATISGWNFVSSDENQMAVSLISIGPLSVAVDAVSWQFYIGGVLYNPIPCGTSLDHGVLIVGFGSEVNIIGENMPFWIIKNSWGSDWGESGYIRIERGDGYCGVNLYCLSSFV